MIKTLCIKMLRAVIRIFPDIPRWIAMAQDTLYCNKLVDSSARHYEKWGINFRYRVPSDGVWYIAMDEPVHSFLCPDCGAAMVYRRFGRYRCENPDCRHTTRVPMWGQYRLYDYIRREIKRMNGV